MPRPFYREPLLHFLLLGAIIFGIDALRGPTANKDANRIVVTQVQIKRMAKLWVQSWQRPPSDAELQALVRDHIREEIYYREALKLGLDVDDTVIRRRLRQKMEFLATAVSDIDEPDDETLKVYLQDNASRYEIGRRFSFEQVYFRDNVPGELESALAELRSAAAESRDLGDTISLPASMSDADGFEVSRIFGAMFFESLQSVKSGEWQGPLTSGFGVHLVRISSLTPARMPSLDEVSQAVENDWRTEKKQTLEKTNFEALLSGYDVKIESPSR